MNKIKVILVVDIIKIKKSRHQRLSNGWNKSKTYNKYEQESSLVKKVNQQQNGK